MHKPRRPRFLLLDKTIEETYAHVKEKLEAVGVPVRIYSETSSLEATVAAGVGNDRVDESSQKDGIAQIGRHLTTFRNSSCHNGSSCGSERKLEEEEGVVVVITTRRAKFLFPTKVKPSASAFP
jgi:hypothetical protein